MKRMCAIFAVFALCCLMLPAARAESARLEGDGYDAPEDAVYALTDALGRGDVGEMLSTFAIETFAAKADTSVYVEARGYVMLTDIYSFPITDAYSHALFAYARYGRLAQDIMACYIEAVTALDGRFVSLQTQEERQALYDAFEASPLNGLEGQVEFIEWIEPACLTRGNFAPGRPEAAALSGADDYAEVAALIRVNGQYSLLSMQCARYGDRWYNLEFGSTPGYSFGLKNQQLLLHILTDEEKQKLDGLLAEEAPGSAVWDAVRDSGICGERWYLTDISAEDLTPLGDSAAASGDENGVWGEMHFYQNGSALLTIAAGSAAREFLGMNGASARFALTWSPACPGYDSTLELLAPIDRDSVDFGRLSGTDAMLTDGSAVLTLPDGTRLVFERPNSE